MTVTTEREFPTPESIQGIRVVDSDTHLTEPGDLWTEIAPAKYKDQVPRVVVSPKQEPNPFRSPYDPDDMLVWKVGDTIMGRAGGGSVVDKDEVKHKGIGFINWTLDDVTAAAKFVQPRLQTMDRLGIHAQIIYPNVVGFGGQAFMSIEDSVLRNLCAELWNDRMAQFYRESDGRLNGMAMLPWWDIDACVKEVERVHSMGLKGLNMTSDTHTKGMPPLSDKAWEPLWEAIEGVGMPVNFHVGSSDTGMQWYGDSPWPGLDGNRRIAIGSTMLFLGNARVIANLAFSGILDRHPSLKFVSVESGLGWIPFVLEALDYEAEEADVQGMELKPSEYFYRNMYATFWFEQKDLLPSIEKVGWDRVMFETDFPHPTCLYPDPLTVAGNLLSAVDREKRENAMSGNAARLYNLDLHGLG